jgi:WD40 repeat protein
MARRGDRDGAVLYALEAMGTPTRERRQRLQEYLDPGLARLLGTIRPPATLTGVEADAVSGLITLLDSQHEITVWRPGSAAGEAPQRQQRLRLAASTERRQRSVLGPGGRRALLWPLDAAAGDAVEVWDVGTARVVARLAQPPGLQSAAFVLGQDAVLLSAAPELRLHDARSGRLLARLPDALLAGERVLKAVNGRYLGWRQADGGYAVFDVARMRLAGTLPAVGDSAPVALDPLGQLVAVAVPPDVVSVRAVPSGAELARCQLTARAIALDFDPQGRWLVVQSDDGRLTLHEPTPGCPLRLQREGPRRWHAAFSLDSEYLLVGNLARGYELVTTGTGVRLGAPFQPGMGGAGALPGGTASLPRLIAPLGLALTYDGRKAVKLWSLVAPDDPAGRQPPPAAQIAIAADGRRAVRAGMAGELQFLDVPDSGDLRPPAVRSGAGALQTARHGAPVTRLAFDDRGRRLASGGLDGSLRLWNATRGEPVGASARHDDGAVIALHFLPGGRWLASATARSVQVLDTETATVIARLPVAARTPSLLVGPDGVLYIGGDGEGVTRWDWRTGTATALVAANYRVRTATLSRDGQWLATAGADRIVRLWRLGSTAPLPQTHTVPAMVEALTFSVDGRRLWLKSGAWLTVLDRNASGLSAPVTRSLPDADSQLVAALPDGAIRLLLRPAGSRPQLWSRRADEPWLDAGRSVAVVDPAEPPARLRLQVGENGTLVPIGQD